MYYYRVGMYGGSFDPLHMGHLNTILEAASICRELHIILSYSERRDRVPYRQRYQWLVEVTKHLSNVTIHAIPDNYTDKDSYNWGAGANTIKEEIGKPINIVFCGSDYKDTNTFEPLYPGATIRYTDREIIPVSSTLISENIYKYWEYIPKAVRPYYTKKVLVIGGESTGKSTLVTNLALHYNTAYLPEVGRFICEKARSEEMMLEEDLLEILIKHKSSELDKLKEADKVLFIDTDSLTTLFYHGLLYPNSIKSKYYKDIATGLAGLNHYDLVVFSETDTEFIQDGTRNEEIKSDRDRYSDQLRAIFDENDIKYHTISGSYLNRFSRTCKLIDILLGESKDEPSKSN